MGVPANLVRGDSASWTDSPFVDAAGARYDSSGWSLRYEFRGAGNALTLNAATSGIGWKTTLATSDSAALDAGTWYWAAILSSSGQRVTIARGQIEVAPDITETSTGYDGRSAAEIALQQAEQALATFKASQGRVKKYTIGARSMEFATISELLEVVSFWRLRVESERQARSISDGLGNPKNLYVRWR